ncbi:6220_t:CDS:2, partial [Acaulospora morrowiae]
HITAVSVVHQVIEKEPWYLKEDSRQLTYIAITSIKNLYEEDSEKYKKLCEIPFKFDDAFEGVCSLRDIDLAKRVEQVSIEEIETNFLSWKDPEANQVISSDSEIIKRLSEETEDEYKNYMEPVKHMEGSIPLHVKNICNAFVSEEVLVEVATGILDIIGGAWKNPAFGEKFAKSQSEGTYVTDIIVPLVKASLKKLSIKSSAFVSTAERQSIASKDRRGKTGKRPDIMFMVKRGRKIYELMFAECSRLFCDKEKEDNDWVKLWREMNDGCKPKKEKFGIIGIQVAGQKLHLYVLIRDGDGINRLFRLRSVDILIQFTDK